jgi:hypothetical protein
LETIVARPLVGRGMFQNTGILRKNGSHIKIVGISEKSAAQKSFFIVSFTPLY